MILTILVSAACSFLGVAAYYAFFGPRYACDDEECETCYEDLPPDGQGGKGVDGN